MKHLIFYGIVFFACLASCSFPQDTSRSSSIDKTQDERSNFVERDTNFYVYENGVYVATTLDEKPMPVDGEKAFFRAMYGQIKYPPQARTDGVQGTVLVTVVLNELGVLESAVLTRTIGAGCDEEALSAVKRGFKGKMNPAIKDGKAIKVKYEVPVVFRLE